MLKHKFPFVKLFWCAFIQIYGTRLNFNSKDKFKMEIEKGKMKKILLPLWPGFWPSLAHLAHARAPRAHHHATSKSSLMGFGGLDDNPIKVLTFVLSVEHVLGAKLIRVNTSDQVWWSIG
jgi:hypothetical protein